MTPVLILDRRTPGSPLPALGLPAHAVQFTRDTAAVLQQVAAHPPQVLLLLTGAGASGEVGLLRRTATTNQVRFFHLVDATGLPSGVEHGGDASLQDPAAVRTIVSLALERRVQTALPRDILVSLQSSLAEMTKQVEQLETRLPEGPAAAGQALPLEKLSSRERDVLAELRGGLSNKEIAARLYVSPHTVGNHLQRIYRKLGVHGRTELVARMMGA